MVVDDPSTDQPDRAFESRVQVERALRLLNCGGPSAAELFLTAAGELKLRRRQAAHVETCPVCQRWLELAQRELQANPPRAAQRPAAGVNNTHALLRRISLAGGLASNADGGATLPSRSDWCGLWFQGGSHALHDVVVRYGGSSYYCGYNLVDVRGNAALTLSNCVIEEAGGSGLYTATTADVSVTDSIIRNCGNYGVQADQARTLVFEGNTVQNCNTGLGVAGTTNPTSVSGNTLEGCSTGVLQQSSVVWALANNIIRNNTYPINQGVSDLVYEGNTVTNNTYQVIAVGGGNLVTDAVWESVGDLPDVPYVVTSYVQVPAGRTLTITAGRVIKFNNYQLLWVTGGFLDVQSSPSARVVFTSYRDDTYGGDSNADGGATLPSRSDWCGLVFQGGSHTLHDVVVRYGGSSYYCGYNLVDVRGNAALTLSNCVFEEAGGSGLYTATTADVSVTDSIIRNCGNYGFYHEAGHIVQFMRNSIQNCPTGLFLNGKPEAASENSFSQNTKPIVIQTSVSPTFGVLDLSENTYRAIEVTGGLSFRRCAMGVGCQWWRTLLNRFRYHC